MSRALREAQRLADKAFARRQFSPADRFFNALSVKPGWGFVWWLLYTLYLIAMAFYGAIWERRLMTRKLP